MASTAPSDRPKKFNSAFAIFEGGGAKGLGHIGALRALETEGHALVGVAGTSAGAIMAALVAVGYGADEIFCDGTNHILATLGFPDPVTILGPKQWLKFKRVKRRAAWALIFLSVPMIALTLYCVLLFLIDYLAELHGSGIFFHYFFRFCFLISVVSVIWGTVLFYWFVDVLRAGGIFDASKLQNVINEALRAKLAVHYADIGMTGPVPAIVEFQHIDPRVIKKCIPLKIVVTNVRSGTVELFDNRDSQTAVAEVVAASAALPLAFRPARITTARLRDAVLTDGGLVSNLPTWVFNDAKKVRERLETLEDPKSRIPIYGFSLKPQNAAVQPANWAGYSGIRGSWRYARAVINAGIFGSQSIIADFLPDLRIVDLRTNLNIGDFDVSAHDAAQAVDLGFADASRFLRKERFQETFAQITIDDICSEFCAVVATRRATAKKKMPRLRVFLIDPVSGRGDHDVRGFRVIAGSNCNEDADDRLELDVEHSVAAEAFRSKKPVYAVVRRDSGAFSYMTKYEKALMPANLKSVIVVPIFADPLVSDVPERILALDSSDVLRGEFNDAGFMAELLLAAVSASRKSINQLYESKFPMEAKHGQAII